jgi:hypothetical protein
VTNFSFLSKLHPFTEAGNRDFNSFVWLPSAEDPGGEVLLADSTIFSTLFGADDSLKGSGRISRRRSSGARSPAAHSKTV